MNDQYANEFDKPWEIHPDVDTPVGDVDTTDIVIDNPERPF